MLQMYCRYFVWWNFHRWDRGPRMRNVIMPCEDGVMKSSVFCTIAVFLSITGLAAPATFTVAGNGSGDFTTIQAALDAAVGGVDEIVVANGTYTGVGNRDLDFKGKAIVLRSIGGAANCIIDCQGQGRAFIFQSGEGSGTVVDGFTIINGYHPDYGGAIECDGSSPTISNCVITNCSSYDGGAIDCYNASPIIVYCTIMNNHALNDGGAIECYDGSNPTITDCVITGNTAGHSGGGIDSYKSSPMIVNCEITDNTAASSGGGIECYKSSLVTVTNCLLVGNTAGRYGGAIDCYDSQAKISYCTIVDNTGGEAFGGFGGVYADALSSLTTVTNSILWNNGDDIEGCSATYSCIQEGDGGEGTISENPQFRTGSLGDYYLRQTAAGQQGNSPCANAGTSDLETPEFDPSLYTTRTDNVTDADVPDMGYHYPDAGPVEEYELAIGVLPDPDNPNGIVEVRPNIVGTFPFYRKYAEVRLRATPDINAAGYRVGQWHGLQPGDIYGAPNDRDMIITMLGDRDVRVEFAPWQMYVLTAEVEDTGEGINGTITAQGGAATGEPGQTWQYGGNTVIVRAVADPGWQVRQWTGTDNDGDALGRDYAYVTMLSDKTVTVEFVRDNFVRLDVQVVGSNGSVVPKRKTFDRADYPDDWPVEQELEAIPDEGYRVRRWTGTDDDTSTDLINYVTMNWSKTVTVEFEEVPLYWLYTNVYSADGGVHGTIEPEDGPYPDGTEVELLVTPDEGWEVVRWYGTLDDDSIEPNNVVIIDGRDMFVFVELRETGLEEGWIILEREPDVPYETIQAAIDAAIDNDVVIVARGVYTGEGNVNLNISGNDYDPSDPNTLHPITVRSEFGPNETIIDCEGSARGFRFGSEVDNRFRVQGFTIRNGRADRGGALYYAADRDADPPVAATPIVDNCIFEMNRASEGGGAIWIEGVGADDAVAQDAEDGEYARITNCVIHDSMTQGNGGAIGITNGASPRIISTEITGNMAGGFGGGIFSNNGSLPAIINCLITLNQSGDIGGAIYVRDSNAIIRLCTIMYNQGLDTDDGAGPKGGIAARDSEPEINHCIIGRSGYAIEGFGEWGDQFTWGDDLFDCSATYSCIENGDGGDGNVSGDPLHESGRLGDYYLSQIRAGQEFNSPCYNSGQENILEQLENQYGLSHDITTSILDQLDVGNCDMGYHYPISVGPPVLRSLTMEVFGDGYMTYSTFGLPGLFGEVYPGAPVTIYVAPGTMVDFMAYPEPGYRVFRWTGTADDYSTANGNYVTVYNDSTVRLEFEKTYVRTFNIPGDFSYTQVQRAINTARSGDTVVLHSGVYTGADIVIVGKDIVLTSAFPNDPAYVAATVLDFGFGDMGMHIIGSGEGYCVLNGITIANARSSGPKMPTPPGPGSHGGNGSDMFGLSLTVDGSHIIANCIIRDAYLSGSEGGDGHDGNTNDPFVHAGNGGWGSSVGGSGLYVGPSVFRYFGSGGMYPVGSMSPIIKNCTITNCISIAGSGGNGGYGPEAARAGNGGVPGRVFGGAVFCDTGTNATFIDCRITDNLARGGIAGQGGDSASNGGRAGWGGLSDEYDLYRTLYPMDSQWFANFGDPRQWTANGGGIYIGGYAYDYPGRFSFLGPGRPGGPGGPVLPQPQTHATLINCDIANNIVQGSISGRGGNRTGYMPPFRHYQIPAFGGGVYAAADANAVLTDCMVLNNRAEPHPDGAEYDDYHSPNQYYGYGGGVALHGATVNVPFMALDNCQVADNFAPVGGGMYWIDSYIDVADSNMINNRSFIGGGVYFYDSPGTLITNSLIEGNNAVFQLPDGSDPLIDPDDPDSGPIDYTMHGAGGGVYGFNSNALIVDTTITQNNSSFSGGGVYLGGHPESIYPLLAMPELKNSLITHNTALQDGGGVSINWYADVAINNCTIADNIVTGTAGEGFGYGGGVSVAFNSLARITDSIIWYNRGSLGAQLAVSNADPYSPGQPQIDLQYSTVGPFLDPNSLDDLLFGGIGDEEVGFSGTQSQINTDVVVDSTAIYGALDSGEQTVKIVVTLKEPADVRDAVDWKSPASVANLHQEVAARQNAVLSTLAPAEFVIDQRYQNFAAFSGDATREGVDKLAAHPWVAHIEPERYVVPMMAQALTLANALAARQAYDGSGVSIAIVDTGIDYTHPMLGGGGFPNNKVIGGHDTAMKDVDPMPDFEPHGTACAGIAAGSIGLTGDYIGGVAYGAKLYALKIMNTAGAMPMSAGLAAWDWCLTNMYADPENPILSVSNSWGIYGLPFNDALVADSLFPSMATAADALTAAGITVLAASGNDGYAGEGISFPSALSSVISVGAVFDTTDMVTGYSNTADLLDILAPGDPIYTTDIVGAGGYAAGDYFPAFNGTSAACPFAAGAVASVQSAAMEKLGRYLTPQQVRQLFVATGRLVTDTKVLITKPRINLGAALASLTSIPIYVGEGCELPGWDAENELWDFDMTHNIFGEPDFVNGYYLGYDSPCVDAGSALAELLGMDVYTTRLDGEFDSGMVDMGYHYSQGVPIYPVQVTVIPNPANPSITGTAQIELPDGTIVEGTQISADAHVGQRVTLRATPAEGMFVKGWYDRVGRLVSTSSEVVITVDEDNLFTLEFKKGRTIEISGGGDVLRQAVLDAQNGDILIVAPGVYQGNIDMRGKKLKIVSVDPNDPDTRDATIINCGPNQRGFIFQNNEDSQVVISGFTIMNGRVMSPQSPGGEHGGAMYFDRGTSPIVKNVRIVNSSAFLANGGALYIAPESHPTFVDVIIEDCWVELGSGGAVFIDSLAYPTFIRCTMSNCSAFDGAGGAVYCAADSMPVFIDCIFSDNAAGLAGGAIFFAQRCKSEMTGCQFLDNTLYAVRTESQFYGQGGAVFYNVDNVVDVADCNFIGNTADKGGAVYLNRNTTGVILHSLMQGNFAGSEGGAVHMNRTIGVDVLDCAIVENEALRGGGLFSIYGVDNLISGCSFRENVTSQSGANAGQSIAGYGGGLYAFGEDIQVVDCAFSSNMAGNSGGGLYLSGDSEADQPEVFPRVINCLVTNNSAGKTGGGISCSWFARPLIANCTIADNSGGLYGGGVVVAYEGQAEIIDSIVWANYANDGAQVAVINDFEFDPAAPSVTISYSDIGPLVDPNLVPLPGDTGEGLVITPMVSATHLVETLLGEGIEIVGLPTYTGAEVAAGTFTGGISAGIGIEKGIILTSGDASLAVGPNISDATSRINNFPGDPDLDAIVGGGMFGGTNDATVLEFNFETRGGNLFFNYVFASEEYNEFTNSMFNDVFAFFLDGQNIALVPGTQTPVAINTINGGNPLGFNASNPELFNNNDLSDGGPFFDIEYDGFTVVLTARALNIGPGVHNIKLAIADVADFILDSAVFIQAGSFSDMPTFSPPVYVQDGGVLNGTVRYDFDPLAEQYNLGEHVINDDPMFAGDASLYGGDDPLLFVGGYMLSYLAAGQPVDSNCIDIGSTSAVEAGLAEGYTNRTDLGVDTGAVDLGYHYRLFERAKYTLTVLIDEGVIGGPYGSVTFVPEPLGYDEDGVPVFDAGTTVEIIGVPDSGYRVRRWFNTIDQPAWQQPSNTVLMNADIEIGLTFERDIQRNLLVPTSYATIEEAVTAASPGDRVIVDPGVHYVTSAAGINFDGKDILLTSRDPMNPGIVAQTIIDCQGSRTNPRRAFHFFNGETRAAQIRGFTIRNGFWAGAVGRNAFVPAATPFDPDGNPPRFRANDGESVNANGYGGAILCENRSSPTFENCIITSSTVTGGIGGNGANGRHRYYNDQDGEWAGYGGDGSGNGYGGAVACRLLSNPAFRNCVFSDNVAMGGLGGNGGNGGDGNNAGSGGHGGYSSGVGRGGAIYAENDSNPEVTNCTFTDNIARWGYPGRGGVMGEGNEGDPPAYDGSDGYYYNTWFYFWDIFYNFGQAYTWDTVAGGAIFYGIGCDTVFTDCVFTGNKAFEISSYYRYGGDQRYDREIPVYTIGGAIYAVENNVVSLSNCRFSDQLGGAVYCEGGNTVTVQDCTFNNNESLEEVNYNNPEFYDTYLYGSYAYVFGWYAYGFSYEGDNRFAPSGGLYVGPQGDLTVTGSSFLNNRSYSGGAINTKSSATFTDCTFTGNSAGGAGGAVEAFDNTDPNVIVLDLTFQRCTFAGNDATWGGAIHAHNFDATITDSFIVANQAQSGGGLFLSDGMVHIDNCIISENKAIDASEVHANGIGGGIVLVTMDVLIENSILTNNHAEGGYAAGGAIIFHGGHDKIDQTVKNCLFTGNTSQVKGGAVAVDIYTAPRFINCTFSNNIANDAGGAIDVDWMSSAQVINSIFENCSGHAVSEEMGSRSQISHSIFHNNPDGDYGIYDLQVIVATGMYKTLFTSTSTGSDIDSTNINADPLFVEGPLGSHYLDQAASPAVVVGGLGTAADLGLDTFTTDGVTGAFDTGTVDIGYHYVDHTTVPQFTLSASVVGGHGTVSPTSGTYYAGTIVPLTAEPEINYRVKIWTGGTINDLSKEKVNLVIMGSNKVITVEFDQPRVLVVGSRPEYTSIQRTIDDAADGDIVMLPAGQYIPPEPFDLINFWNRDITLTGPNPDDPGVVAATVLDGYRFSFSNTGPKTIIEGITIRRGRMELYSSSPIIRNVHFVDCNWFGGNGPMVLGMDGMNGGDVLGGAIEMYNSSPQILNCRFENCSATGGNGGDGWTPGGFDGGWAGRAYGGAVYAAWKSNPIFRDCVFENCFVQGGNGGDGGDGPPPAKGGRGGNWIWADSVEQSLFWSWWDGWEWGDNFGRYGWFQWAGWYNVDDAWYQDYTYDRYYNAYYDFWKYTGLGGAFYCEANSSPKFYNCEFVGNSSYGGVCGVGGVSGPILPERNMDIGTAGGAIYIADNCTADFFDCLISNNTADTSTVEIPDDYYVSYGGGVAVEGSSTVKFISTEIANNTACMGGGVYWLESDLTAVDCNVVNNTAYHGGGFYSTTATGTIDASFFTGNLASVDPMLGASDDDTDPLPGSGAPYAHNVLGQGGGYYSFSTLVDITDSVFKKNMARASGGGIYFGGSDQDNFVAPTVFNCLIANNTAGRDGGGVSVNWYAEPEFTNVTIADNLVTGAIGSGFGYGGGLYASYNSRVFMTDSIIWGNAGANGAQIAVGSGDTYGARPSEVTLVHTDVGPPYDPNATNEFVIVDDIIPDEGIGGSQSLTGGAKLVEGDTLFSQFDQGQHRVPVIVTLADFTALRRTTDWSSATSRAVFQQAVSDRIDSVLNSLGYGEIQLSHRYRNIAGFAGEVTWAGLNQLLANPLVAHVEPDRMTHKMLAQGLMLINAIPIRDVHDGSGVSIAVSDTGIDYNHPMLGGGGFPNLKVIGGYDTGDNDPDPIPNGDQAHGTACAGIAAGNYGINGDYIGGVAYNAKLYALKISFGDVGAALDSASVAAWDWCITHQYDDPANPIMVISHSFGGGRYFSPQEAENDRPAFAAVAQAVVDAGITPLAASGNEYNPDSLAAPAAFSNVISVGAVYDTTDQVIPYSNTADFLDILAPSEPAYTTDISGAPGYDPGDYYPYFNGTSAACPYAAGAVASIQHAAAAKLGRTLLPVEIRNLLIATGVPVTDTKAPITKPRINLAAAIAGLSESIPIYVEEGCILHGWDAENQEWDPDTFNFMEDPLFVGDYFLSEKDAKQLKDSPCVPDRWQGEYVSSRTVAEAGLLEYTTRTDSVFDDGMVNLGFHHFPFEVETYKLNYYVIVDPFELPNFEPEITPYDPNGLFYEHGTQVELTVTPPPFGFHSIWKGTDDDSRREPNNVVTMVSNKIVTVTFETIGYRLDAEVIADHEDLPQAFVADIALDPPGGVYYPNTEVTITVTPPPAGFQVRWEGADDNTIVDPVNMVTMNMDRQVTARYVPIQTDYYAVIVGISNYFDFFAPAIELPYASRDARELAVRLAESPNWRKENIYTLIDSQATKAEIRNTLHELAGRLDHDDVVLFYFSGFGYADVDIEPIDEIDGLDEYLITYEWDGIRDDELGQMFAEFATDNYVVILETDFAAGHIDGIEATPLGTYTLSRPLRLTNTIPTSTPFTFNGDDTVGQPQDLNRNEAGVVITACGVDEVAFYSDDFRHGVFTYYLLRALEGKADWQGNNNGWVSAEEAYRYLAPNVNSYIRDMVGLGYLPIGTRQRPRMYDADRNNEIELVTAPPQGGEPKTWYVPGDADRIQKAIDMARDGDVIVLGAGVYSEGSIVIDKAVTLTGANPDDPDVVAMTVIDVSRLQTDYAIYFTANAGPDAVLNGITITANGWFRYILNSTDGFPGGDIYSGGLIIGTRAAPTIKNCVISGFTIYAGRGGDGDDDDTNWFNGDGGDGGNAFGGGVYCLTESAPTFINTTITDCHVFGGDGGNGAEANEYNFGGGRGGWGGWARGGGVYVEELAKPVFIHCTISDCTATGGSGGEGGSGATVDDVPLPPGYGGNWSHEVYLPWELYGYEGDYTLYSAYGGGIYCAPETEVKFIDCTISGNRTQGGLSGLGGELADGVLLPGMIVSDGRIYPFEPYEIPTHGGGLYCAADSIVHLEGCTIADNVAPKPADILTVDPELGYGGGASFEDVKSVSLIDCVISGNEASAGGGVYWYGNNLLVQDCNFVNNLAFSGGGLYGIRGEAVITGGFVHRNYAGSTELDTIDVAGRGGGIYLASVSAVVKDVEMYSNQANVSGGALFLTGTQPLTSTINNCLLYNNFAGRDGGGVSANWFSKPVISNCTFKDNWATGYFGYIDSGVTDPNEVPQDGNEDGQVDFAGTGGGLYCAYSSLVEVVDSIFWGNYAANGRQIAVGTGFEFDPRPSTLKISYSNVQGGRGEPAVLVEDNCVMDWSNNMYLDPRFTSGPKGEFYLSQLVAGQNVQSPCVDAGSNYASVVGMSRYTTRTDDAFNAYDLGVVDIGYHYRLDFTPESCRFCDFHLDGIVELADLAIFAEQQWLRTCQGLNDCQGADLNGDTVVDLADFVIFASCWFAEDTVAPMPDPAEWDMKPHSMPEGIEMSAVVAEDAWFGDQVWYRFICTTNGAFSSPWQQGFNPAAPNYRAEPWYYAPAGLTKDMQYEFVVRVRDPRGNTTADSVAESAIAKVEGDPPTPNPSQWATLIDDGIDGLPRVATISSVSMVARVATDASGPVEYFFRYTNAAGDGPGLGDGHDSGWQLSPTYEDIGLTANMTYSYRVRTRDRYGNESGESPVGTVLLDPALVDFNPPEPNPPVWAEAPAQYLLADGNYWHYMSVEPVADPEGNGEEYFFECLDNSGRNSKWQHDQMVFVPGQDYPDPALVPGAVPPAPNERWVRSGSSPFNKWRYRVRTRDQSPNQNTSSWSTVETVP